MESIGNQIKQKLSNNFSCEICDYNTYRKSNLKNHFQSIRHKNKQMEMNGNQIKQKLSNNIFCQSCKQTNTNQNNTINQSCLINSFVCNICSKIYHSQSGLWKHKKNCNTNNANNIIDKDFIMALINSNQEFQKSMFELFKEKTTTNSHNNSHNKSFNLQFFLNEQCKDAMNLSEFVSSIVPTMEDLETTGRLGYAEGISRIFIKKLDEVGTNLRPVHCTDLKREVLYIKEGDKWEKDDETKTTLTKAIKSVSRKSANNILVWRDKNRGCTDSDSRKNDLYLNIVSNSMSGSTEEETEKNYNKIINKITKEVVVDKD